ncbi:MAG TPA: hypothetical protein VGC32_09975 [Solirubrobacterales bacterium]
MIRNSNIKTILKGAIACAALTAAMVVPAGSAMANQSCPSVRTDPTQAQYCSVSAANESGSNSPGNNKSPGNKGNDGVKGTQAEGGNEGVTTESVSSPVETTAVESSSSSLPFTGLDVGVLAAVALALVGTGVLLRRLTRSGELGN